MEKNFHYEETGQRIKAKDNLIYASLWLFLGGLMFFAGSLKSHPTFIFVTGAIFVLAGIYKIILGIKRLKTLKKD